MTRSIRFEHEELGLFFELELREGAVHKRSGAIGTAGKIQKTRIRWDGPYSLDRIVEAAEAQGYRRAKSAHLLDDAAEPVFERNLELEEAIAAEPENVGAWIVYADWLQHRGDPRGELITVQLALESGEDRRLTDRERTLFQTHGARFLGALRNYSRTIDPEEEEAFTWRRGFIDSVRISYDVLSSLEPFDAVRFLRDVLEHPSGVFVREISLGRHRVAGAPFHHEYQLLIETIVQAKPKALRELNVGHPTNAGTERFRIIVRNLVGDLGGIWSACPQLERIRVRGGEIRLGRIHAPVLREAVFDADPWQPEMFGSIVAASWPKLERLELGFGRDTPDGPSELPHLQPLLDREGLRHLALRHTTEGDAIARALVRARALLGLESLDLSSTGLTDAGARVLAEAGGAFRRLARLDLSANHLTEEAERLVSGLAPEVITARQHPPADPRGYGEDDELEDRYGDDPTGR